MKEKYFIYQVTSEVSEEKNECQRHQNWHFKPKFHDFSLIFHYYLQHFEKYRNLMEKYRIWDQNIGKNRKFSSLKNQFICLINLFAGGGTWSETFWVAYI